VALKGAYHRGAAAGTHSAARWLTASDDSPKWRPELRAACTPEMTVILSDRTMREQIQQGRIRVEPLAEGAIQPSSIDLRLGDKIRVFQNNHISHIDLRQDTGTLTEVVDLKPGQPFFLRPLEFALGVTVEHIVVPDDLVARLDGKSSLGRVGLLIHATAGLVDPGWEGRLTLELMNLAPFPITLFAGMRIGQISFIQMTSPVDVPYGHGALSSKYQGDTDPTPSRYHLELSNWSSGPTTEPVANGALR
jgi:dCTP deaminase